MHVALCHILLTTFEVYIFEAPRQINTFSLAHVHWLDDECLCLFLVELVLEVVLVRWQHPRFGEEVEIVFEDLCHAV